MADNKRINIMTSCDDNLAKQLLVLLQSIADNLSDKEVYFYLFHTAISHENIELLKKQCTFYGMIHFEEVVIPNPEAYEELTLGGGRWCKEAYYSLCVHELLPEDVDRVLYLDAGDVIINGNIDEYYFADFEGKSIFATLRRFKLENGFASIYDADDMAVKKHLKAIVEGVFNSGSFVMNIEKLRKEGYSIEDYQFLSRTLQETLGGEQRPYLGDQGLLSAAFIGDIKYYGYPKVWDLWFMPFNFGVWYFNARHQLPGYDARIIHFSGTPFKPWKAKYPIYLERFQNKDELHPMSELKLGQAEYYYLWHEYAIKAENTLRQL